MSPITTHVLDLARGRPAQGLGVVLEFRVAVNGPWTELARGTTNADGRITDLLPDGTSLAPGVYRLRFDTGAYFASAGVRGFYPEVTIMASIDDPTGHHHLPLLLSPFGYSTYRGS
jgi:5-hydroxyisourate hydrolase